MPLTLPPAQNAVPAPVSRSTPTSGFSPQVLIMVRSAGVSVSDMALRTSGRFSVMMATRSRITHRSSSVPVSTLISLVSAVGASLMRFPPELLRHCGQRRSIHRTHQIVENPELGTLRFALAMTALQNFSTHGRNSSSQVQALRGCCRTFQ